MNYSNENRGALFKNDKQGNEKRPDYTGTLNVDGKDLQISAWIKASKAGTKYMSLTVQPKREREPVQTPERSSGPVQTADGDDWNDSVPF